MKKQLPIMMVLAVFAIGIITSCKKDPIPNNNEQNHEQPSDTIPIGNDTIPIGNDTIPNGNDTIPVVIDGIHFGDTTGMIVTPYNTTMEFDESWHPIILDLDGDGNDDIKIETYYDGPLAIGEFQELTLYCLNNRTELLGDSIVKESYSHRDTTITINNGWTTTLYSYTFSTCGKVDENDYVGTTMVFELKANDANEPLNFDDPFQYAEVKIFRENIEYSLYNPNEEEQTVVGNHNKYIYECWNFPTDEEKYIGLRITHNGNSRYGWLKIKLHPTWGGKVVDTELIETAIQK